MSAYDIFFSIQYSTVRLSTETEELENKPQKLQTVYGKNNSKFNNYARALVHMTSVCRASTKLHISSLGSYMIPLYT